MVTVNVERALDHPSAAHATYELRGIDGWPAVVSALCDLIHRIVPCDVVVWQAIDLRRGRVVLGGDPFELPGEDAGQVLLRLEDHPVKNHFLGGLEQVLHPIRISDLMGDREFRRTRTWAELFGPVGVGRQLSAVSTAAGSTASGWALNRTSTDFTDHDVEVLEALLPLLTTLELDHRGELWADAPTPEPVLTSREVEVLELVGSGLTAAAASRRLGISEHTVRRHLEHVYAKCGHHDRLLAVRWAVQHGLIDPGIG